MGLTSEVSYFTGMYESAGLFNGTGGYKEHYYLGNENFIINVSMLMKHKYEIEAMFLALDLEDYPINNFVDAVKNKKPEDVKSFLEFTRYQNKGKGKHYVGIGLFGVNIKIYERMKKLLEKFEEPVDLILYEGYLIAYTEQTPLLIVKTEKLDMQTQLFEQENVTVDDMLNSPATDNKSIRDIVEPETVGA